MHATACDVYSAHHLVSTNITCITIDVSNADVDTALCVRVSDACMCASYLRVPFVPACTMPCPGLCEHSVCACLPCLLCLHRFEISDFCVRSAQMAWTRAFKLVRACALLLSDIQRGCAHALLSMWVHAYFFSVICNERWALISFGDICVPFCPCSCGYTLTNPPPHTLPYYPRTKSLSRRDRKGPPGPSRATTDY